MQWMLSIQWSKGLVYVPNLQIKVRMFRQGEVIVKLFATYLIIFLDSPLLFQPFLFRNVCGYLAKIYLSLPYISGMEIWLTILCVYVVIYTCPNF